MTEVASQLEAIITRIQQAEMRAKREPDSVKLIAVSKTWPADHVQLAVDAGQRVFGENKLQEGQEKIPAMSPDLEWHYIGGLQRNKVRKVLPLFPWVHSIDSLKLANYTNNVAKDLGLKPKVLLQVNIGREESKGGFSPEELVEQFPEIYALENLDVRGLMCIPPAVAEPEQARDWFAAVRELRDQLVATHGCALPELSMGMSGDFEVAIEEGATFVRVGSSIFGQRDYAK